MGQRIIAVSLQNDIGIVESTCLIRYDEAEIVTDEFETPYDYEVLMNLDESNNSIQSVAINGADRLLKVIDNNDCLPDVGLLDYKDEKLGLDLRDVTLRELYKEILKLMIFTERLTTIADDTALNDACKKLEIAVKDKKKDVRLIHV